MRSLRGMVGVAVVVALLGWSQVARAAIVVVDDLTTTTSSAQLTAPGTITNNDAGGGILGGTRDVTLNASAANGVAQSVAYSIGGAFLSYSSGTQADGDLNLFYDAGGAGLGLDASALTSLDLNFVAFDFANNANLPVTVTLTDGSAMADSETMSLTAAGPAVLSFPLASFAVDLSDIFSINIFFDAQLAHDFTLQFPPGIVIKNGEVPEPSSIILWGSVALIGAWFSRRKLMKRAV